VGKVRKLSTGFMRDLKEGVLTPVLERVRDDGTLDLEIRDAAVNMYYRGINALEIVEREPGLYGFRFDTSYGRTTYGQLEGVNRETRVSRVEECRAWLRRLPHVKDAMDCYCGVVKDAREKEAQQLLVRENNRPTTGRGTDYYICDVEHARTGHDFRFDAVAVRWPSRGAERKKVHGLRLAVVEVKFGESALRDKLDGGEVTSPGLVSHARDLARLAAEEHRAELAALKADMVSVFAQKLDLGLVECTKPFQAFSDEHPELILVLVNQDPDSPILEEELARLRELKDLDIKIAQSNPMGMGLYCERLVPLAEFRAVRGRG
jgi:hypothetical protein